MSMRTTALVAAVVLACGGAAEATPRRAPACLSVGFSPRFAHDRTMFCAYEVSEDGAYLARSADGGRTWRPGRRFAHGNATHFVPRVTVSPWYASDRRVFASTGQATYESTDEGTTFRPFHSGTEGRPAYSLTPFLDAHPVEGAHRAFAFVGVDSAVRVYDPLSGQRTTLGTVAKDRAVVPLIPPDYADTRRAVLLAQSTAGVYEGGNDTHLDLGLGAYTCAVDFVCRERHFYFGNATFAYGTPLAAPGSYVVVTRDNAHGSKAEHHAWRTSDHGRTWRPWTSVERLLPGTGFAYTGDVVVTASPDAPRRLFLHVLRRADAKQPGGDDRQSFTLYRSDDDGATWRVAGRSSSETAGGTLPWNRAQWFAGLSLVAQPGGRLYSTAAHHTKGRVDYQGVFCSADLGRTWRRGGC